MHGENKMADEKTGTKVPTLKTVSFWLGGAADDEPREYVIGPAPHFRAKEWRKWLVTEVKPVLNEAFGAFTVEFEKSEDLAKLLPLVDSLLNSVPELVYEAVVTFHPSLEKEKVWIGENASDEQIVAAFSEILRVADPFGLTRRLEREATKEGGLEKFGTLLKSLTQSGDSTGTTSDDSNDSPPSETDS
jgi:hypothetical protein